jgi:hypothetical protein
VGRKLLRVTFDSVGGWLDKWGRRLSNIAQVGLCAIAAWGLIYTVIPLYRLSWLDNELARKTMELDKTTTALEGTTARLASTYQQVRYFTVQMFVFATGGKCSGLLRPAQSSSPPSPVPEWKAILDSDPAGCILRNVGSKLPQQLSPQDWEFFQAQLANASRNVAAWQAEASTKCEALATAAVESLPKPPDYDPRSPLGRLKALREQQGTWMTPAERRESAQYQVVSELGERVRKRLDELNRLEWPAPNVGK